MNSLQRTQDFIEGKKVDRPPFHPILMRLAAKYAGIRYRDFCLDYRKKVDANIKCATDFKYDWVNVMSDPYAEASAYGTGLTYPENNLPQVTSWLINEIDDTDRIKLFKVDDHPRLKSRVDEVKEFSRQVGNTQFICGWVEGPLAEYCDLRDVSPACMDLYENPEKIKKALTIIAENAMIFAEAQVKAGAHCIGMGDAVCSLISPDLYQEFVFPLEKAIVDHVHSLGAKVKLHICGNTSGILPDMIKTGADIVDIDHLAGSMGNYIDLFPAGQVPSGNSDPVSVIMDGNRKSIEESVKQCYSDTKGRGIVSAGCEIPPDTTVENMLAYMKAAHELALS
ncbi:MAG: uroporphyrinogen decarboxylase family protein [Bacteroidia bacterium]|nr:uroporphyrinogen decarboxylase family protein [Bacteroidia bacterium]